MDVNSRREVLDPARIPGRELYEPAAFEPSNDSISLDEFDLKVNRKGTEYRGEQDGSEKSVGDQAPGRKLEAEETGDDDSILLGKENEAWSESEDKAFQK